ncbi:MAG: phenylalanine--tRNA ligase subunit beta [Desulfonauticus sp.]|nr:phenylalanine--tRNA ligase subunit beta [Desulfonauticus sp.]
MLLSLNWLKDFVPFEGDIEELAHRLTMVGLEVEEIVEPFSYLKTVVVGKVVECQPHPNSDHLSVCRVDVGKEILPIVCGAPNVSQGQFVPVALIGTCMPSGFTIKKAKLRGEVSCGMICSQKELELGDDQSGIWVLDQEFSSLTPGQDLISALGLDRYVLDIGITPNRADCLSVLGLAREIATLFSLPLSMPKVEITEDDQSLDYEIDIPAKEHCYLYQARLIEDCQIKVSPSWMRFRLLASGIKPINNVVDVTNYVLLELGQPLHAFDRDFLEGNKIRVALAGQKQSFTTLDGNNRKLLATDLLIWDAKKPVALAGIMGGANSEIRENSSRVLLECAVFNPITIRKTARRLGISSEASYRFERGIDQLLSPFALQRATALIQTLAKGKVLKGLAACEPKPYAPRYVSFRAPKVSQLLGVSISEKFCHEALTKLGCKIESKATGWEVLVPSFRHDLEREIDLVEEVGRIYGLDKIEAKLPKISKTLDQTGDPKVAFLRKVKHWSKSVGLKEAINYSFVGSKVLNLLGLPEDNRVYVLNPLSEEQNVLRTDLLAGLLHSVQVNANKERFKLFEIAKTFFKDQNSETLCRENNRLGIVLAGKRYPSKWPFEETEMDYTDLKGILDHFLTIFVGKEVEFVKKQEHPFLKPAVEIVSQKENYGFLGLVKDEIALQYDVKNMDLWYASVDLDKVFETFQQYTLKFQELPKFPATKRDITLVCPLHLCVGDVFKVIKKVKCKILEDTCLTDIYFPKDKKVKHVTLRLTYRAKDKTLKDKEVDKMHKQIADILVKELKVTFP